MEKPAVRRQNPWVLLAVLGVVGALAALARHPRPAARRGGAPRSPLPVRLAVAPAGSHAGGRGRPPVNKTAAAHAVLLLPDRRLRRARRPRRRRAAQRPVPHRLRAQELTVSPVPGTGNRYAPFALDFGDRFDRHDGVPDRLPHRRHERGRPRRPLRRLLGPPAAAAAAPRAGRISSPRAPLSMASLRSRELVPDLAPALVDRHRDVRGRRRRRPPGHRRRQLLRRRLRDHRRQLEPAVRDERRLLAGAQRRDEPDLPPRPAAQSGEAPARSTAMPATSSRATASAAGRWRSAPADLDRDGLSELYIANDFGPDQLLWNRSRPGAVRARGAPRRDGLLPFPSRWSSGTTRSRA